MPGDACVHSVTCTREAVAASHDRQIQDADGTVGGGEPSPKADDQHSRHASHARARRTRRASARSQNPQPLTEVDGSWPCDRSSVCEPLPIVVLPHTSQSDGPALALAMTTPAGLKRDLNAMPASASAGMRARGTRQELEHLTDGTGCHGVMQCIDAHKADHSTSRFITSETITDTANPAFRQGGSAKMCVATQDLKEGCFIACFPGSGDQTMREPHSAYEEAYCFELAEGAGRLIPTNENDNALSSLNDFRTNVNRPAGPQDRACSVDCSEIWIDGKAYLLFFTLRPIANGEELLWDYGVDYWHDQGAVQFRCQDLASQEKNWKSFRKQKNLNDFKHAATIQVLFVVSLGCVWSGLLALGQPQLAATCLCIGTGLFAKFLVERSQNRPT